MKTNLKKILAVLIIVSMVCSFIFVSSVSVNYGGHVCHEEHCIICSMISTANSLAKTILSMMIVALIIMAKICTGRFRIFSKELCANIFESPVSLKVKLIR